MRRAGMVFGGVVVGLSVVCAPMGGCSGPGPVDGASDADRSLERAMSYARQGQNHADNGRFERAVEDYETALSIFNEIPGVWNNLGEARMQLQRYADAVSAFNVAADLSPADPRPMYNIGLVYQTVGWAKDARTHYGYALDRDPNMQDALRGYAVASDMLGVADERTLEFIRTGLLNERDEEWREFLNRQRFRVEARLRLDSRGAWDEG